MALFRRKNGIKRAIFVPFYSTSTREKETLVTQVFLKTPISIVEAVCRAAIIAQERKTSVNFGWFLAIIVQFTQ